MSTTINYNLPENFAHRGWSIRYMSYESPKSSAQLIDSVVFVHGTPWSSDVFRPLVQALAATELYNIVLYDLAGYGQSQSFESETGTEPDVSVKAQGEALAALLRHLGLDGKGEKGRPHIIAHDIAGVISLRAHLLHGCEYQSLCLLDTNCVLPWGDKLYNLVRSNPHVFEELPPNIFEGCLRAIIQSARVRGQGLGPEWEDVLARPWLTVADRDSKSQNSPQSNFVRQIKQSDDSHTAELLDSNLYTQVRCDVKILWGEKDGWIPYEKMQTLADMLGHRLKAFVTVPNAGHLVMLDQPERVTLEISRWLEKRA